MPTIYYYASDLEIEDQKCGNILELSYMKDLDGFDVSHLHSFYFKYDDTTWDGAYCLFDASHEISLKEVRDKISLSENGTLHKDSRLTFDDSYGYGLRLFYRV